MGTRPSATRGASTPATRTATASARSTSTRPRASGHSYAPGAAAPGHLAGEAARLSRLLPGRPQRPAPREGPPHDACRDARHLSPDPNTPDPEKSHSALSGAGDWPCPRGAARPPRPVPCCRPGMLFREDFVLSERAMEQQQWTVTRRLVGHPGAQRRWDRAYQLLLPAATTH